MQKIFISNGHLTDDAELKCVEKQGKKSEFISFRVAVNEKYGNTETATFFEVTYVKSGIIDYLKKGQAVNIIGNFRFRQDEKDGKSYFHLIVRATDIELAGSKKTVEVSAAPEEEA